MSRAAVVQRYFSAASSADVDTAMAQFADNAVFIGAGGAVGCSAQAPCTTTAGIRAQLQANIARNFCQTPTSLEVMGSEVVGRVETRQDNFRANGIERTVAIFMAQVSADKITNFYVPTDLSDPQTLAQIAIVAGTQAAGAPIPAPATACG